MNNENFQYLSDNIKYMGFGENLKGDLEKNMNEAQPEFQLKYKTEINNKPFEATLNFRKSDSTDMYFFNSYQASLERTNNERAEQTFYLNKGKGITAKEAFNLLDGRSVHKELSNREGQPYQAWVQIDFGNKDKNNNYEVKQFHENYGYDLKKALGKYAIAELNDPEKEKALLHSLQKGNLQAVTIEEKGNVQKMFIEANPQFKTVNLYDAHLKPVLRENLEQYQKSGIKQNQAPNPNENSEVKKNDKRQDVTTNTKQKDQFLPKKKNSNGLLQKKRVSTKKGLTV